MSRTVNLGVLEHLFDVCAPDLQASEISLKLIRAAGDAIADMMLDIGYQVETTYIDGRDVVQSYFNPRTGSIVDGLAFTLGLAASENRGVNLHVLLKVEGPQVNSSDALSSAVRESRGWYQPLNNCATVEDVLDSIIPETFSPWKTAPAFEWRVAA
jgi:hypothetical protein